MFEHHFRHEVVGLKSKVERLGAKILAYLSSVFWRKLPDTFPIVNLTKLRSTKVLQFELPKF